MNTVNGSIRSFTRSKGTRLRQSWRLPTDPGPSKLHMQYDISHNAILKRNTGHCRPRSFYSSSVLDYPKPSRALRYPRWINNKRDASAEETEASQNAEEEAEEQVGSLSNADHDAKGKGRGNVLMDQADDSGRSSASASSSSPPSSSDGHENSGGSNSSKSPPPSSNSSSSQTSISKQSVPEFYPQVLALPIARRPLFPGFYKAVVIRNPSVVAAIKDMMKRGQPYLGAFLLKDENVDSDVITDLSLVHPVGVFAQITSVFAATGKDDKEEGLTAVLYPHRRIRLTDLIKAGSGPTQGSVENVDQDKTQQPTPPPSPSASEVILPEDSAQERRMQSGKY